VTIDGRRAELSATIFKELPWMANPGQTVVRLISRLDRLPTGVDGRFVIDYDPRLTGPLWSESYELLTTTEITEARGFANGVEALDFWRQVCPTHPRRDDGRPNRPLAAFSVAFPTVPK
jgi:hypothetical protein